MVKHLPLRQRFVWMVDGVEAFLTYQLPNSEEILFDHTYVPTHLRGKGIGEALVKAGFAYAQEHGLEIKSTCSFVTAHLKRHTR